MDNFLSKTLFFSMTMMLSRTLALNNKIFTLAVYLTSCLMASSPKFEFRLSLRTSIRKLEILSQLNDFVSMSTYSVVLCTYLFTWINYEEERNCGTSLEMIHQNVCASKKKIFQPFWNWHLDRKNFTNFKNSTLITNI